MAWVLFAAVADADEVSLDYERWRQLHGLEPEVEVLAPGPRLAQRTVVLTPLPDGAGMAIEARWQVQTERGAWLDVLLVGPEVTVDALTWRGRPATSVASAEGTRLVAWVDGAGEAVLRGTVASDPGRGAVRLQLQEAARGEARLPSSWALEGDGVAWRSDGRWGATGGSLAVVEVPPEVAKAETLAAASVGVGVTVGDAEVTVAARAVWRLARGSLPVVRLQLPGAGADLTVSGPLVERWERGGDTVTVWLRDPDAARIEVEVRYTAATPQGEQASLAVPDVRALDAYRTSYALQVARDGEVEVVPEASGWEARASAQLPPWARGLVQGDPSAAYVSPRPSSARLQLYRFEPVQQPPTLVDVQQITAALSDEGRVLMRVHYAVRNERGAYLRVEPPPGLRILGAVVSGETADPAADGDAWLVPLKKSVETVQGLLSFPVQLVLVGEVDPWDRKERRQLPLPRVDAEIASSQVTVHLPPGYLPRHDEGEHGTVASFAEGTGIAYGFAVGDARAAEADRLFQDAVSNWMSNDFDQAQAALDELSALGAGNENVVRLQSNLDLLEGKGGGGSVALERRVKEQAKARSLDDARKQAEVLQQAEQALISGDYDGAEAAYGEALALGDKLGKLDQDEELDNRYKNLEVEAKLAETRSLKKAKDKAEKAARASAEEERRRHAEEERRKRAVEAAFLARERAEAVAYEAAEAAASAPSASEESIRADRLLSAPDEVPPLDAGFDRSEHLPPPIQLSADTFATVDEEEGELVEDEAFGVPGGVEGGVVGGVLGGVVSGSTAGASANENTYMVDEPMAAPTAQKRERRGPTVKKPSLGARKPKAAEPPPPPEAVVVEEVLEKVPAGRSYQSAVTTVETKRSSRRSRADDDTGDLAALRSEIDRPTIEIRMGGGDELPDVKATSLDVIVPAQGAAVRFQRHLVPADAPQAVVLEARRSRRSP